MVHAVYIGSNDYWGYDSDTFNDQTQFFGNSWITKASDVSEENRSEHNLNRCAFFYEIGKTDSDLFTPTKIEYEPADDFLLITGDMGAYGDSHRTFSRRRAYSLGEKAQRYHSMTDGPNSRGVGRFKVDYIVVSEDSDFQNIRDFIKELDEKELYNGDSNVGKQKEKNPTLSPCKLSPLPDRTSLINYLPITTYPFENSRDPVVALLINALDSSHKYIALKYLLLLGYDVRELITGIEDYEHPARQPDLDEILYSNFQEGMEEIFVKYLSSPEVDVYDDGAELFGPNYDFSITFLVELYSDADSVLRMNVVKCLADIAKNTQSEESREKILSLLRKALDDDSIDIVGEAGEQLCRLEDLESILALESLITSEINPSTLQISAGLSWLGSVKGAKKLVELMSESNPSSLSFHWSRDAKSDLFSLFEKVLYDEIFSNSNHLAYEATTAYLELCKDSSNLSDICTRIAVESYSIPSEANLPQNAISMIEWSGEQALFEVLRIVKFGPRHLAKKYLQELYDPPSNWVESELLPEYLKDKSNMEIAEILAEYGGEASHLQLFEELKSGNYLVNRCFSEIFSNSKRLTEEWQGRLIDLRLELNGIYWFEIEEAATTPRVYAAFNSPTKSSSRLLISWILTTYFNSEVGEEDMDDAYNRGYMNFNYGMSVGSKSAENLLLYIYNPDPYIAQTAIKSIPKCDIIKPENVELLIKTYHSLLKENSDIPDSWIGWNSNNIDWWWQENEQPEVSKNSEESFLARFVLREEILNTLGELVISSELFRLD